MISVTSSGCMSCTMGLIPSMLGVLPINRVMTDSKIQSNIMDHMPLVNVMSFGMCKTPTNPAVAAVIIASLGSVTQAPCIPMTMSPWMPGSPTVLVGGKPAVSKDCKLMCAYGGMISITSPGQFTAKIP
ncbi:DUF4280 domain-containing protein [Candidatus Nesciobacter abundans]|nr:DUF4280 domain-containing protein [Candidatus Nesciobacter abundans]